MASLGQNKYLKLPFIRKLGPNKIITICLDNQVFFRKNNTHKLKKKHQYFEIPGGVAVNILGNRRYFFFIFLFFIIFFITPILNYNLTSYRIISNLSVVRWNVDASSIKKASLWIASIIYFSSRPLNENLRTVSKDRPTPT